jgi:hypothetical protein
LAPADALAADVADPGDVDKTKAQQQQLGTGKYGQVPIKPFKSDKASQDPDKPPHWVEIVLLDEQDKPVAGEAYSVTLPDGQTVASGTLDEKGFARLDGIDPGTCTVTFPNLDGKAWKPA